MNKGRIAWVIGMVTVALVAVGLLSHCSIYEMTGDMTAEYATEHMAPYLMTTDDLDMACETGVSMGGVLLSFGTVADVPHKAAISTLLTAGTCAEVTARELELKSIRAMKEGRSAAAKDARIAEKRAHMVASRRYYQGAQHLIALYGELGGQCPELEDTSDEVAYLLGLLSALQAVQHDRAAAGAVGVPLDFPAKVARSTKCLNNEAWWGVPKALEAAVWTSVPGTAPKGADPWAQLAKASEIGMKKGVRLAQAIEAQSAVGVGKKELLRKLIVAHVASLKETPSNKDWRLLDLTGTHMIQFFSDRIWTEAVGHRTPHGGLGTFWDAEVEKADDDLFDDEEDEDEDEAASADAGAAEEN